MTQRTRRIPTACLLLLLTALAPIASAQRTSPVYLQDSPRADEALPRTVELADAELYDEAARVLYELTVTDGDLLIEHPELENILVPVRTRVNELLIARPALLQRYRELHEAQARNELNAGAMRRVERDALLTRAGYDAVLLIARDQLEHARFLAAWRTLAQLDEHPDRRTRGREAARALSSLWSYIEGSALTHTLDPGAEDMLRRWRTEAGLDAALPAPIEPPVKPVVSTVYDDPGTVRIDDVLAQPILSRATGTLPEFVLQAAAISTGIDIPTRARVLHAAPVLVDDTVYTNTGITIGAWNRFSGQALWQRDIDAPFHTVQRFSRVDDPLQELLTLCVDDDILVALTGLAEEGNGVRERLLIGLDPATGEDRWRVALSDLIDTTFESAILIGPPVLVEGSVVIRAVERDIQRRTIVHHLMAFDARTGALDWTRPIAGMGARPYGSGSDPAEGITAFGPDVVFVTSLGAILRVEASTGRVRWARRAIADGPSRLGGNPAPWRFNAPVVTRDSVVTLTPDRRQIVHLDAHTGAQRSASDSGPWDQPHTLQLLNGTLVGISHRSITMCPLDQIDIAKELAVVFMVPTPSSTPIRGRVTRAGDRLYAPTVQGLVWIEPPLAGDAWFADSPPMPASGLVPLVRTGNALVVDGQVVIADDERVHTYFSWRVAREILERREASDPSDPGAPITFAQLAYRAGVTEEVLPALDRALGALARDPLRSDFEDSRTRLFNAVLRMARPDRDSSRLATVSDSVRRELLDRLERLATTPDERVSSMMTAGAFFEAINAPAEAIERYQRILAREDLRERPYEAAGVRTPAATEVGRRLTTILATHTRRVYAPYDDAARARLDALGDNAGLDNLLAIAREFPAARLTPELYRRVGMALEAQGESRAASGAFESGLRAVIPGEQPELAGELAGRAVVGAAVDGRYADARQRVREFRTIIPDAPLRYDGRTIDTELLLDRLTELGRSVHRRPVLGDAIDERPDVLPGLRIQRPIVAEARRAPARHVVFRRSQSDEIALWALDEQGTLAPRLEGLTGHDLIYLDDSAMYTSTLDSNRPGRRVIMRYDVRTGAEAWRTLPFEDLFDPELNGGINDAIPDLDKNDDGLARSREIVVLVTQRTMILLERTGRAVGIDLDTGRPIWARRLSLTRVLDADTGSGVIAAVGLRRRTLLELKAAEIEPALVEERLEVIDERTGKTLHTPTLDVSSEWVRVTPSGTVLVGAESTVSQFTLRSGRLIGASSENPDLTASAGARALTGRTYVLSGLGILLAVDTNTSKLVVRRVDADDRFVRALDFRADEINDLAYIATPRGFFALDDQHKIVTGDARPNEYLTTIPEFSDRFAVAIDRNGTPTGPGEFELFPVLVHELETGRLARRPINLPLPMQPDTLALIDGHILITSASSTVILHAPVRGGVDRSPDQRFNIEDVYERRAVTP